ncbi:hypothetical protein N7474_000213 [Penicillium riverlandense]|uniref:uncharacterized protein n=1 Tax=Penicillium riverlandense TaxID=1903569 RepID=UPI002547CCAB|nr:uncharacterized protein N7474_000213 [Penicillium riverlandense]KAJ5831902.1 hypothetical protein N7474_000213 [Penicillium riverlandense]
MEDTSSVSKIAERGEVHVEKLDSAGSLSTPLSTTDHYEPTSDEEKALDIDKTNIGYVATSTFISDAHLSKNAVGDSLSLFSATYVPLQPLSVLAARRFGPKYWIAGLLITWGMLCMCHAAIQNQSTLIALRLLLGAAESGFTPSSFYLMSTIYPKYILGLRMGIFSGMYAVAGACAGLIAYGLLQVSSTHIKGWQVLFLLEGGITVIVGIAVLILIPARLETCWFLTYRERKHAIHRMRIDQASTHDMNSENGFNPRDITDVLKDWKKILIVIFNILGVLPVNAFTTFLPLIVEGMGYDGIDATLMSVSPFVAGAVVLVFIVWSSDRSRDRSGHIVGGMVLALIGCIVMATSNNPHLRYGFSHVCMAGIFVSGPLTAAWLAGNTPLMGPRSFILGLNGYTNVGGVIAGQLYLAKYSPDCELFMFKTLTQRYLHTDFMMFFSLDKLPLIITVILIAVGIAGLLGIRFAYMRTNRWRLQKLASTDEATLEAEANADGRRGDQRYTFTYGY